MTKEGIIAKAATQGIEPWVNVEYEDMARSIEGKLLADQPDSCACIGEMPDGTWMVWHNPAKLTWSPGQAYLINLSHEFWG